MNDNAPQMPQAPGDFAPGFTGSLREMHHAGWPCKGRFKCPLNTKPQTGNEPAQQPEVELSEALRIKSAEMWLKLGEVKQALLEIGSVPESLKNHPWVIRIHLAIVRAASESRE